MSTDLLQFRKFEKKKKELEILEVLLV